MPVFHTRTYTGPTSPNVVGVLQNKIKILKKCPYRNLVLNVVRDVASHRRARMTADWSLPICPYDGDAKPLRLNILGSSPRRLLFDILGEEE